MSTRIGILFQTLLIVVGVLFWSVSVLADHEPAAATGDLTPADVTLEQAKAAAIESAAAAVESIRDDSRLELDVRLAGVTPEQVAAK